MISIRLTEDEFNTLHQLCEVNGARSVSDLARNALHKLLNGNSDESAPTIKRTNGALESKVKALDIRMNALDRTVEKLAQVFTTPAGGGRR